MNYDDDYEKRGFFQKFGFGLGIGAVGIIGAAVVIGQISKGNSAPPPRMPEVVMIRPLPPPPPPPPPEPPKEVVEKMVEQEPIDQPEPKPDDRPKDPAPAAVTTSLTGPGSDGFGLGAAGSGGLLGGGGGNGRHSRFGWYAGEVQTTIQEALSRNRVTSRSEFDRKIRIWADITGRVTRVKLEGPTDDMAIDQAIDETLTGLQLQEPPPKEMPMPIVMRLVARRPS
jgi:hypothetical protein